MRDTSVTGAMAWDGCTTGVYTALIRMISLCCPLIFFTEALLSMREELVNTCRMPGCDSAAKRTTCVLRYRSTRHSLQGNYIHKARSAMKRTISRGWQQIISPLAVGPIEAVIITGRSTVCASLQPECCESQRICFCTNNANICHATCSEATPL